MTVRSGCATWPAENATSAASMAPMRSSIERTMRTSCSERRIGISGCKLIANVQREAGSAEADSGVWYTAPFGGYCRSHDWRDDRQIPHRRTAGPRRHGHGLHGRRPVARTGSCHQGAESRGQRARRAEAVPRGSDHARQAEPSQHRDPLRARPARRSAVDGDGVRARRDLRQAVGARRAHAIRARGVPRRAGAGRARPRASRRGSSIAT